MVVEHFRVVARVSSSNPQAIKPVLEQLIKTGSVKKRESEFIVEAEMAGDSAKELNRFFLSALRRVEKKTRLRAEWTSDNGTTQRFFDYVLKKTTKSQPLDHRLLHFGRIIKQPGDKLGRSQTASVAERRYRNVAIMVVMLGVTMTWYRYLGGRPRTCPS